MNNDFEPLDQPIEGESLSTLLGKEEWKWASKDGTVSIVFGRPPGLASMKVARVLGSIQSTNLILTMMYLAILAIKKFNGEAIPEPSIDAEFLAVASRFGTISTADENFNDFVVAFQQALHPETRAAIETAYQMGESPDVIERIASQAGAETAKK